MGAVLTCFEWIQLQTAQSCSRGSRPQSELVGVYPRGFSYEAQAELLLVGASVQIHYEAHCAFVFLLPEALGRACTELGTFSFVFELVGGPIRFSQEPTIEQLHAAASAEILRSAVAARYLA